MDNGGAFRRGNNWPRQPREQGAYLAPAMTGTQGGPVQESEVMQQERLLQGLAGGLLAAAPLWALPMEMAFPPYAATALGGSVAGMTAIGNALEPNIRDVWADQERMQRQQRSRR